MPGERRGPTDQRTDCMTSCLQAVIHVRTHAPLRIGHSTSLLAAVSALRGAEQ